MSLIKSLGQFVLKEASGSFQRHLTKLEKRHVLDAESYQLTQKNLFDCEVGDFVRYKGHYCMVIKNKNITSNGYLIVLDMPMLQWHYQQEYCPYTQCVSADGGCQIKTDATSHEDGVYNTNKIIELSHELRYMEDRPGGCPLNSYHFPLFDKVKKFGNGWFVPSINELTDCKWEQQILNRLRSLILKVQGEDIPAEAPYTFWSSTDNSDKGLNESGYAFCMQICESNDIKIMFKLKNEKCIAMFFHKF